MNPYRQGYQMGEYAPPNMMLTAYAFVDGGYFREEGKAVGVDYPNPHSAVECVMQGVREMGGYSPTINSVFARRVFYYDAPDPLVGAPDPNIEKYWEEIEKLPDTQVRFGTIRGRRHRQKGVDILLSVDMLVGAVDKLFDVAVLVSGDEGFVPLVSEVQRRGVSVVVAGVSRSVSSDLRLTADRYVELGESVCGALKKNPIALPTTTPGTP